MPGRKFTMLPEDVIARFSLDHGGELPVVSLYVDLDENYVPRGRYRGSSACRSSRTCATPSTTF